MIDEALTNLNRTIMKAEEIQKRYDMEIGMFLDDRHEETIEALHEIIKAYSEDEGYIPERVADLYNKYHAPWLRG